MSEDYNLSKYKKLLKSFFLYCSQSENKKKENTIWILCLGSIHLQLFHGAVAQFG